MARGKVHKVDYDCKAFLVDVTGMKGLDVAVYWVACSLIMADNRPIPRDDERIFGVLSKDHPNAISAAINRLIERAKSGRAGGLSLTPRGHLTQGKATREVGKAQARIKKATSAAEARWGSDAKIEENHRGKNAQASTQALPSSPSIPPPSPYISESGPAAPVEPEVTPKPKPAEPPGFAALWLLWPLKKARVPAAGAYRRALKRGADANEIMAGATRYSTERHGQDPKYTKKLNNWLNEDGWTDLLEPAMAQARRFTV